MMMFTAKSATAGVILMEWNIAQTSTGEAAMWGKLYVLTYLQRPRSFRNILRVKFLLLIGHY